MNVAHLHLIINHAPVVGLAFTAFLLLWAAVRRSAEVRRAALVAIALVALTAIPVYLTGDKSEDVIANVPGLTKDLIDRHEDASKVALVATEVLGVVAVGALVVPGAAAAGVTLPGVLVLNLLALATMGWAANLGGQIHHPEAQPGFTVPAQSHGGAAARPGDND
ncbi:MAG TPA: hypothetical protein VNJ51_02340 [Candidatus Dormibacteraeota bacterium]|nr:hypothetical protein [Candidatus Dormibacteraeota bacterium]